MSDQITVSDAIAKFATEFAEIGEITDLTAMNFGEQKPEDAMIEEWDLPGYCSKQKIYGKVRVWACFKKVKK